MKTPKLDKTLTLGSLSFFLEHIEKTPTKSGSFMVYFDDKTAIEIKFKPGQAVNVEFEESSNKANLRIVD